MSASKYIKIALLENDMQQKELAQKLGVSNASVSQMLKNDNIGYNKVEEIANLLGYEIVWRKKNSSQSNQTINKGIIEIGVQNINN